ncbi:MAG: site-specific integrase [Candidatus Omnitrophica bacterium]|nr:site-specific integrase [Candidatus Omnitrophota bacterium]MDE2215294.1 site-specific integrase [Candidatus Omnitrophota bacterium]MDE2232338.1 site-specific integrase [Candidatus Omnitrophota bacterium]
MSVYNRVTCPDCGQHHNVYKKEIRAIVCTQCKKKIVVNPAKGNFFIELYAGGRRIREKVGSSRKLAETVEAKRKLEIAEDKFLDTKKFHKIKFEDFAKEFLNVHSKVNKKSWQSDEYNLNSLGKYFAGKYLSDIKVRDIENYKVERLKTHIGTIKTKNKTPRTIVPTTVNRELATLKTMFNKAVIWGRLRDNPAKIVQFLREPPGRVRFLEQEEIVKLLTNANKKLRPILVVALNTGMRRGEIFGLKWHDADFKRNTIHLYNTKNGEKREVDMNEQVKTALIRVFRNPDSPYIFCKRDGKPVHDIRKSFWTALKKSGIKDFHFHDLRHTFASQLVMSGIDLNTVRELLGHKDIRMTLRYSHLSRGHKRHAVEVLGKKIDTFWTLNEKSQNKENSVFSQPIENKELIRSGT